MRSRNPKKYMKKEVSDSTISKFQPSRSLVLKRLQTIEEKVKQQHKTKNGNDN